ncbi:MAG TPA: sialate O-acetylesterase [Bacteroides sp.]|nr:sialate O-acetylesterase [Bacteroides sp.]
MKQILIYLNIIFLTSGNVFGDVSLPAILSDNMVLQRDAAVPIWGWADPGEEISVRCEWAENEVKIITNQSGAWQTIISTPASGGPYHMIISGKNTIRLNNILMGEVWVCSGQSNMHFSLKASLHAKTEIPSADIDEIRLFKVERQIAEQPLHDCPGSKWIVCNPESVQNFSAVAYHFGKVIHEELNVPVGLIQATWGGTPAEAWSPNEVFTNDTSLSVVFDRWTQWGKDAGKDSVKYNTDLEKWKYSVNEAGRTGKIYPEKPEMPSSVYMIARPHRRTSVLFNGMIRPLIPYKIKGVVWYQGESNRQWAYQYKQLITGMITSWRSTWEEYSATSDDFPFYYVQIAPNGYSNLEEAAELREAQLLSMDIDNSGMVVTADVGNMDDIHPRNKRTVGYRLALWALARDYGFKELVFSGPIYKSFQVEEKSIRVFFDHTGTGLMSGDGTLKGFTIAGDPHGADTGEFLEADATIDGNTVVVRNDKIKQPSRVRYGWTNLDKANLFNNEGLPVSPFRTDIFQTENLKNK